MNTAPDTQHPPNNNNMSITQSKASNEANTIIKGSSPSPSPSISTATASSINHERELDEVLHELQKEKNIKIFESKEMTEKRRYIIVEVERLTTSWIQSCLKQNNSLPQSQIDKSSSYICAFGSYELNVHFESSDIDLLCIGPKYITRDMLFTEFVQMLNNDKRVTDILQLRHAFVPLLKFTFEGIDIDLVYAQWDIEVIDIDHKKEAINVFSSNYIRDQDTLFSLNGVRATETIKKLIPNKCIFEKTLRIIKFWAQQRAIYSNVMGFLGGISWSIMTALICIQNPEANCVEIIRSFFAKYKDYDEYHPNSSICLDHTLYDAMYDDDKSGDDIDFIEYTRNEFTEIMPILTPARPAMNCAYNVIEATKSLIIAEIKRGYHLTQHECIDWKRLFCIRHLVNDTAASSYEDNVYIRIQCICIPDPTAISCKKWSGFIESKIRNLVKKLNRELFDSTFYPYSTSIKSRNCDNFFIAGKCCLDLVYRQNNQDIINMTLQLFQHQMDSSAVRYDCGGNCQLKLDVYHHSEIHDVLSGLQCDVDNIIPNIAMYPAPGPHYNILQQIQLMNITNNANNSGYTHTAPPHSHVHVPPHHNHNHNHNNHNHNHNHNHHQRHHHRRPHRSNHHHHHNHNHYAPPRHQRRYHRTQRHNHVNRNVNVNNQYIQPVFPNLTPISNNNKTSTISAAAVDTSTAAESLSISTVDTVTETPKGQGINSSDDDNINNLNNLNKRMDEDVERSRDSDSNESIDNIPSTSSGDSSNESLHQNNLISTSFQLPNMCNLSSFPIIKIQQQGLPHLPPFVSTQNPHFNYNHNTNNHNFNSQNNSSGRISTHKLLNNESANSFPTQDKAKLVQTPSQKLDNIEESDKGTVFDDKENVNCSIPKGNFIPHERVKIPDAFVPDLNVMESEQFGYPSPNNSSNSSAKSVPNGDCDKSTLIIHPSLNKKNPLPFVNVNINNNGHTINDVTNININNNITNEANNGIHNMNNTIVNNNTININNINSFINNIHPMNGNMLGTVILQQTLCPNVVSFCNRDNSRDSNSELMKSYQNYCNILNVFKINDNTKNNQNVNNNHNNNYNNIHTNNIKMSNQLINTTPPIPIPVNIGYSSAQSHSNCSFHSHSDSSTTPSPNNSPNNSPHPTTNSNPNKSSDEDNMKRSNTSRKPLYSVITATAPSVPPTTAAFISLSSKPGNEYNNQQKLKKRWHNANHYQNKRNLNHNNSNYHNNWSSNEIVAPVPFSRSNKTENRNNEHHHNNSDYSYYKDNNNKWRLKANNSNYRNYSQNHKKRYYSNSNRHRTSNPF